MGLGCGGLLLVAIIAMLTGADPRQLLQLVSQVQGPATSRPSPGGLPGGGPPGRVSDELGRFAAVVLGDTEVTWGRLLPAIGHRYEEPTLVLFDGAVSSACGFNSAASGPFYCPADRQVYLDLSFFAELERRADIRRAIERARCT